VTEQSVSAILALWVVVQAAPLAAACTPNGMQELSEQKSNAYVSHLMGELKRSNATTRRAASIALFRMAAESKPVVPASLNAINDKDPKVRMNVLLALGESGDRSSNVRQAIVGALKDPDAQVRESAREVLETLR
jgi:HEAT repeat protein